MENPLSFLARFFAAVRSRWAAFSARLRHAPRSADSDPGRPRRIRPVVRALPLIVVAAAVVVVLLIVLIPSGPEAIDISAQQLGIRPAAEETAAVPPLRILFSGSAAKIELVGKEITSGAKIRPPRDGRWVWSSDQEITFFPDTDWEPGLEYTVSFDASLFSPSVRLRSRTTSVRVPPLKASVDSAELSIDPMHPEIKRITATVGFNYPVKVEEFTQSIRMKPAFHVTWDKYSTTAYVVSEDIPVPDKAYDEQIQWRGRLSSSRGGAPITLDLQATVTVPGKFDYARLQDIEAGLVRDENFEYQKVLMVRGNLGMRPDDVAAAFSAWALPVDRPASAGTQEDKNHAWSVEEIDPGVLGLSTRVALTALPAEREFDTPLSFSYSAPSGRYLYLEQ